MVYYTVTYNTVLLLYDYYKVPYYDILYYTTYHTAIV